MTSGDTTSAATPGAPSPTLQTTSTRAAPSPTTAASSMPFAAMAFFLAGLVLGALLTGAAAVWVLRRRARRLGRYFDFAAHEFNAPVTAIKMTLFNLAEGVFGRLDETQLAWIGKMRAQAARMAGLVGELRDLSDLELNRELHLRLEELSPAEITASALRSVYPVAQPPVGRAGHNALNRAVGHLSEPLDDVALANLPTHSVAPA